MSNKQASIKIELPQTNSRIGRKSTYSGAIQFKTSLSILGKFSGTIKGGELLVLFPTANIEAKIQADYILIAGTVSGEIYANKGIYLYSSAYVRGDIHSTRVRMQPGLNFEGKCNFLKQEKIDIYNFSRSDLHANLVDKFEKSKKKKN